MIKRVARMAIALGCRGANLLGVAERRNLRRLTILCYHRTLPNERKTEYFLPNLVVTPEHFRSHCQTLRRHYDVLPLTQAIQRWAEPCKTPRRLAVITFDDGYCDNFEYAAPILGETGLTATFFVVTGLIGVQQRPWYDKMGQAAVRLQRGGRLRDVLEGAVLPVTGDAKPFNTSPGASPIDVVSWAKTLGPDLRKRVVQILLAEAPPDQDFSSLDGIMDWPQLASLVDRGHEIGSHSSSHEILPLLDDDAQQTEIAGSRDVLREGLGISVHAFCYPNGDFDERTLRAVRASGYTCAATVQSGSNEPGCEPLQLKRWFIHQDRLAGLGGRSSSTLLRMELCGLAARAFMRNDRRGTHS